MLTCSSRPCHVSSRSGAFIIVFSNLWAIYFREWRGVSQKMKRLVWFGILGLIISTIVVGLGNFLTERG
jgi:L-rhamnose-H+ transport protein